MTEQKNWREMTPEQRQAIQADVEIRQRTQQAELIEQQRQRAKAIVQNRRIWNIGELQLFIRRVNQVAKAHKCLDKLPTEAFPSREAFLEVAVGVLVDNGASQEEIESIFEIHRQLDKTKVG